MIRKSMGYALTLLALVFTASIANAQNRYSYISYYGSGTACTQTQPCNTMSAAVAATKDGGTVVCQDAVSDYNSATGVTINKPLTIDCRDHPFQMVGIGFFIQAGVSDVVIVRGLSIDSQCSKCPAVGLTVDSAASVILENVKISRQAGAGIKDQRTGGQTKLFVKDSTISNNAGPGIVAAAQSVGIVVLDNVSLLNNQYGIAVAAGNNVSIRNTAMSGNVTAGVEADFGAQVTVTSSLISNNASNVATFGTVRLRENDIQFSNTAITGSGSVVSMGGNRFSGNGALGTVPPLASGAP